MAVVKIYDQHNKEAGEVTLSSDVFEVSPRPEILHLVVRAQRAAKRAGTHATLTRTLMAGGGAKPWRQKGTGRARAGSRNSPIWRGGAVLFGPQPRSYEFKVNKKVKSLALKMALSSRYLNGKLMVVKDIELPEVKTKLFTQVAKVLELEKTLIVAPLKSNNLILSARNVPGVTVITPEDLNVYDVLRHKKLVLLAPALETVEARFK
ncbi:50S ribosomal protein L4 [Desulfovibrio litoralis]|uniref:Large ribosomal subunit protein uL4 n=1 Tax=Desulfovibrio litoralis DSM 11393 TaxID=1121455 RepID=A0A1M7SE55_9BACT|nr:50S ribosomal protein L4 [Desulfovibrio litoralis]SHN56777.1 LSU ribosomal protein L4P [Desulfovibrio litoralis DSM 11393]